MQGTGQFTACWNFLLTEQLKTLLADIDHVTKVILGVAFRNLQIVMQRDSFMLSFIRRNELSLQMTEYLRWIDYGAAKNSP